MPIPTPTSNLCPFGHPVQLYSSVMVAALGLKQKDGTSALVLPTTECHLKAHILASHPNTKHEPLPSPCRLCHASWLLSFSSRCLEGAPGLALCQEAIGFCRPSSRGNLHHPPHSTRCAHNALESFRKASEIFQSITKQGMQFGGRWIWPYCAVSESLRSLLKHHKNGIHYLEKVHAILENDRSSLRNKAWFSQQLPHIGPGCVCISSRRWRWSARCTRAVGMTGALYYGACGGTPQWQWGWDWNSGRAQLAETEDLGLLHQPLCCCRHQVLLCGATKRAEREGHRQLGELLSRWAAKHSNFYHATAGHYNGHNFGDWALSAIHLMLLKLWTTKQIIIKLALSLKQIHRII